ncbi:uncharacterized protein LOC115572086 [Sparus aurata]|uniref:Uncharacterized LOC115572086 n=1 Tax=Sparus aurata TaxID=8175 RepID=A0A671X545_SPAAU|nr:uncharacterized protein LOC115572086 [Sparus aurata]
MDSEASGTIEMPALGRPFSLGMLYDCRYDKFIPGMTLWDHNDLVKHVGEKPQNYNGVKIDASESIQEKCSALNIEGSVKASLFCGLISVGGSAKYLHDYKTYKNQARVTLEYEAYTKFQELSMDHLGKCNIKHRDVFEKGLATHVVTGILYGAKAFLVFDREVSNDESQQQYEGKLTGILKTIPFFAGEGSLNIEDKDKQRADEFSCNFHGDFLLDKTPVSFQDAIQVYQSLPKLLGAYGENAVPVKVWLMPLTSLDSSAAKLAQESPVFVEEMQAVLEDLREAQMRCNDALRTAAQQGPGIGKNIQTFKDMCSKFEKEFQQNLAKKLLVIRRGEEEEEAVLKEILMKIHSSPFNSKNLKQWLDSIDTETCILNSLTSNMKNTKIVSSPTDLHKEILSADHAVCFVFPLPGSVEKYLSTFSNYFKKTPKTDDPEGSLTHDVLKEQWYTSKEATDKMRRKAKRFSDFAEANKENKNIKFLAVGSTDETQEGSSIVLYEDGFSVTENFEPPSKPETFTVRDTNHNSVTLKISPVKFGAENITSYSVEYCVSGQDGWKEKTAAGAEEVTVSDLSPNTEYKFKCRAVTSVGVGPAYEVRGSIKTLPCSPPGKPQVEPKSRKISVSWEKFQQKSQRVLEDLSELEMRYNDALKTATAQQFPQIGTKIKTFKEMCSEFKLEFQQTLATKFPSIRGGGEEEAVLAEILMKRHSSPFNSKDLNKWMDCKEREIHTLKFFTNMMKNTKIVSSETDLYNESLSADHTVCFVFTSLGSDEPYRSTLSNYLKQTPKTDEAQGSCTHDVVKEQWFGSKEVADKMRSKAKLFSDFAEANKENKNIKFLAVGLTDETQKGSSIYLYKDGFSVTKNFEPPSRPETLTVTDINHNSVTLKISPAKFGAENITSYSVEYCVSGQDGWIEKTAAEAEEVTVSDLSPNTEYKFRCRAVTSVGVGPAYEVSGSIKTSAGKRLADVVKGNSKLLENQSGPLPVYKVPLVEEMMSVTGGRCFSFGNESTKHNRTIMVPGATGAGKSNLINGMINYILGVEWEDSYRFKLVDEDPSKSQAESQTSDVTVYKINYQQGFKIDYSLTIIDTPGFGDTRGIERDKEITEQLHNLFSSKRGVSEIDAVCFVAQASLARLTPSQKYVFDSVLSIFGKDVAENIRVLVTFADGQHPPVLEAIKASGVPCPTTEDGLPVHFKFNNSAFFTDNKSSEGGSMRDEDGGFDQMVWNMGTRSMNKFFVALNVIETRSLTLTKEVLRERERLENSVEKVKFGLAKLVEIKESSEKLKKHEAEISRNENFEFEVTVKKPVKVNISHPGFYITNCQQGHYTCHFPCGIPNDADTACCAAMGSDGNCNQCASKFILGVHFNQKYKWDYTGVKEKRTIKELQEMYKQAKDAKKPVEAMIVTLKAEYDRVQAEVEKLVESSTECLNRLKEIALKPDPLSTPEYIDMLIEGEKSEGKPGWKQRVQSLMTIRDRAETLAKIGRGEKLLDCEESEVQDENQYPMLTIRRRFQR